MTKVSEAFILAQHSLGERDLLLVLLTRRWGRLSALAKGACRSRRRFVNVLEPFSLIRAHLRGGKPTLAPFLDQADLLEPYESLRLDPQRFVLAAYFTELLESFFRPYTGKEAFFLLKEALEELSQNGVQPLLRLFFEFHLLLLSGFSPFLEACIRCEGPLTPPFAFSITDGGAVCPRCQREEDQPLSGETLALLRHLRRLSPAALGRVKVRKDALQEATRLLELFLRRVLDREINALRVLKEMF